MPARESNWTILTAPLIRQNPVTLQILGLCSALAVTTSVATALTMSAALTAVLVMSAALISLIRKHIPDSIRLIVQIVIVASLVIVIDQLLQAYLFEISQRRSSAVAAASASSASFACAGISISRAAFSSASAPAASQATR